MRQRGKAAPETPPLNSGRRASDSSYGLAAWLGEDRRT